MFVPQGDAKLRTVAVMNEKGGSGKTTTTISLAAVLAERGYRILVVDLDPQASASLWLGRGREPGLYRAIAEKRDRKSTRLNSSHVSISYAVFCLKKKKKNKS